MQKIRTVKPELFHHERLFDVEAAVKLPLRLAFIGLWTVADREGRFEWRPRTLKSYVLPFDKVDFGAVLDALKKARFIGKYEVKGETYGVIYDFTHHQRINHRETASRIPPPPADLKARGQLPPSVPKPPSKKPCFGPPKEDELAKRRIELREEEEHLRNEWAGLNIKEVIDRLQDRYSPASIGRIVGISQQAVDEHIKKRKNGEG